MKPSPESDVVLAGSGERHRVEGKSGWLNWLAFAARLGLIVVFGLSGALKAADPVSTLTAVRAYSLVPEPLEVPVAGILPWFELALALLLLLGLAIRLTSILCALLLIGFIAGVISAAARGLSIDCGCFGGGGQVAPGETRYTAEILRDSGFLVLAGFLAWWPRSPLSVDAVVGRSQVRQA